MKRAYSPKEIAAKKWVTLPWDEKWSKPFGFPAENASWFISGASASGKSSFVMQLAKYLCQWCTVAYDSLEESTGLSFQNTLNRERMEEVNYKFKILDREPMDDLSERLLKRRSPDVVIIDSFQYTGLTYAAYKTLKEKHRNKLLVFVSHCEGEKPEGRAAKKVAYDADMKIFIRGFRAVCKGRFITQPGNSYIIWEEGAAQYSMK